MIVMLMAAALAPQAEATEATPATAAAERLDDLAVLEGVLSAEAREEGVPPADLVALGETDANPTAVEPLMRRTGCWWCQFGVAEAATVIAANGREREVGFSVPTSGPGLLDLPPPRHAGGYVLAASLPGGTAEDTEREARGSAEGSTGKPIAPTISFAVTAAEGPSDTQPPLSTPVPPSALLFAAGLGCFSLSRRRARD